MKNKTSSILLIFGLLLFSLVGSVFLSGQSQDRRGGAYFSNTKLSIQPESLGNKKVGDIFSVQLFLAPKSGSKIDFVEGQVCLGNELELASTNLRDNIILDSGFTELVKAVMPEGGNCVLLAIRSDKKQSELPSGSAIKLASIRLKAVEAGSGNISLDKNLFLVSGYNPNSNSKDLAIEVTETIGSSYTISGSDQDDEDDNGDEDGDDDNDDNNEDEDEDEVGEGELALKIASRKLDKDPKCGKKEKFTITVSNGSLSKTVGNIEGKWENGFYKISRKVSDFPKVNNVAIFIKGSKSLQVKYGMDNQKSAYTKAGGEIELSAGKTLNLTGYPLLPGDVTGEGNKQDGVINGLDFSFVKTRAAKREETKEGGSLQADLDGNCLVNSMDVAALMLSLEDKMDQLY